MTQALNNFFQRSHAPLQNIVLRAIATQMTPAAVATGQVCLDWINACPDALSTAFAEQFRLHLARPETFSDRYYNRPPELQLLDNASLQRQLAEEKAAAQLTEVLRADMLLLFGRLQAIRRTALDDQDYIDAYGPVAIVRALSRALDALQIDSTCGTLLLESTAAPLLDTLKHTYTSLHQFLGAQNIPGLRSPPVRPTRQTRPSPAAPTILAHIRALVPYEDAAPGGRGWGNHNVAPPAVAAGSLADKLIGLQPADATTGTTILRQLQQDASIGNAAAVDLAILDAVAGLFELILDDPGLSPDYKAVFSQLQIPTVRVALATPAFFSDDEQPARQVLDMVGVFSRRFPEHSPSYGATLRHLEAQCALLLDDRADPVAAFVQVQQSLAAWLADENKRSDAGLAPEISRLEQVERLERGTLLALENLEDLTERYPAPESVLRRLEAAWVPHMASLYMAESGEGPDWRDACHTLLQLFLSMQTPASEAIREARLQSIPRVNAALRQGLLAQGADPAQLRDFFAAITATQECWIRPPMAQREGTVSTFVRRVSQAQIESLAQHVPDEPPSESLQRQTQQLREGDWVDFDPAYQGLTSARIAWAGADGRLLFCDSEGKHAFSVNYAQFVAEMRAGRACVPEQSVTRKAMQCLASRIAPDPG